MAPVFQAPPLLAQLVFAVPNGDGVALVQNTVRQNQVAAPTLVPHALRGLAARNGDGAALVQNTVRQNQVAAPISVPHVPLELVALNGDGVVPDLHSVGDMLCRWLRRSSEKKCQDVLGRIISRLSKRPTKNLLEPI